MSLSKYLVVYPIGVLGLLAGVYNYLRSSDKPPATYSFATGKDGLELRAKTTEVEPGLFYSKGQDITTTYQLAKGVRCTERFTVGHLALLPEFNTKSDCRAILDTDLPEIADLAKKTRANVQTIGVRFTPTQTKTIAL